MAQDGQRCPGDTKRGTESERESKRGTSGPLTVLRSSEGVLVAGEVVAKRIESGGDDFRVSSSGSVARARGGHARG